MSDEQQQSTEQPQPVEQPPLPAHADNRFLQVLFVVGITTVFVALYPVWVAITLPLIPLLCPIVWLYLFIIYSLWNAFCGSCCKEIKIMNICEVFGMMLLGMLTFPLSLWRELWFKSFGTYPCQSLFDDEHRLLVSLFARTPDRKSTL